MKSTAESPRRRSDGFGGPMRSSAQYDGADRGVLLDLDGVIDRAALRDGELNPVQFESGRSRWIG